MAAKQKINKLKVDLRNSLQIKIRQIICSETDIRNKTLEIVATEIIVNAIQKQKFFPWFLCSEVYFLCGQ